jgi:hypothetical protein
MPFIDSHACELRNSLHNLTYTPSLSLRARVYFSQQRSVEIVNAGKETALNGREEDL